MPVQNTSKYRPTTVPGNQTETQLYREATDDTNSLLNALLAPTGTTRTVTGNATTKDADYLVQCNPTANMTLTLSYLSKLPVNQVKFILIRNITGNTITLSPLKGTIDGAATINIGAQGKAILYFTGLVWFSLSLS